MDKSLKVLGLIILVTILAGGYFYPKQVQNNNVGAASSSGQTFSGSNSTTVTFAPLTSSSTSILNNGGNDRDITKVVVSCQGIGTSYSYNGATAIASWQLSNVATTSVSSNGNQGNVNYMYAATTIATTSPYSFMSTTTEGVIYAVSRIWPVNTYLTFNFNATNTAACSLTADYFGL